MTTFGKWVNAQIEINAKGRNTLLKFITVFGPERTTAGQVRGDDGQPSKGAPETKFPVCTPARDRT